MDASNIERFWEHADSARGWLVKKCGLQDADAADVVQEVLIRLDRWAAREVLYPKAYLFKACARQAWGYQRKLTKRRVLPLDFAKDCLAPEPSVDWAESNNPRLSRISKMHRRVADLLACGLKKVEVARELNLKPTTVRVYAHQMRKAESAMVA